MPYWLPVPRGPFSLVLRVYDPEGNTSPGSAYIPPKITVSGGSLAAHFQLSNACRCALGARARRGALAASAARRHRGSLVGGLGSADDGREIEP